MSDLDLLEKEFQELADKNEELGNRVEELEMENEQLQAMQHSWLSIHPWERELRMVDVEVLNDIIKRYCQENGIHFEEINA